MSTFSILLLCLLTVSGYLFLAGYALLVFLHAWDNEEHVQAWARARERYWERREEALRQTIKQQTRLHEATTTKHEHDLDLARRTITLLLQERRRPHGLQPHQATACAHKTTYHAPARP